MKGDAVSLSVAFDMIGDVVLIEILASGWVESAWKVMDVGLLGEVESI